MPAKIRERLGLIAGQVLDFDENAPYLRAIPVFDEEEMRSVLGSTKRILGLRTDDWLEETRGPVDLAPEPE